MSNDFDAARVALLLNEVRLPALKRVWRARPPGRYVRDVSLHYG